MKFSDELLTQLEATARGFAQVFDRRLLPLDFEDLLLGLPSGQSPFVDEVDGVIEGERVSFERIRMVNKMRVKCRIESLLRFRVEW